MLEQIKYVNHFNEVIEFGKNGIYVAKSDIHDYEWSVSEKNSRISYFERKIRNRLLPITILCATAAEGTAVRNRLMEVAEKDVLTKQPGRLIVGDYYYTCYISGSKKKNYLASRKLMEADLTIVSDARFWVRETVHSFRKDQSAIAMYLDYPFDYPFDYFSGFADHVLVNPNFTETNFRLIIYGPCKDPVVYIAGHAYGVDVSLSTGEYLTIDSIQKTITKTEIDGRITNAFNGRNRESYIFKPIPIGSSAVTWVGNYGIDIVLLDERSEPKWI